MSNKSVSEKRLITAIVISMFLWGLSWPSGKVLTHFTSVINFSVYRYLSVVATLFMMLSVGKVPLKIKRAGVAFVIASGLLLAAYSYFFFMGLKNGAPGAGGVLVTTLNPIFAYIIGIVIDKRLPSRYESFGLLLGLLAGSVLLKMWSQTSAIYDGGNLYFLVASVTWAIMSKFTSRGSAYGSSLSFSFWQYVVTLLCLLPLTNVPEARSAIHITDPVFWINLVFSSVIVTAIATTVYFFATTRLGAEKASSFIFLVPLAAAFSSWLLLGEHIMPHTIIGGILGIAAVYTINKKKKTQEA